MKAINRDSIVAVVLMLLCAVLYSETFSIRSLIVDPTMGPELWPRIVIGFLSILSCVYLFQSVRGIYNLENSSEDVSKFQITRFVNPVICIICFGAFLLIIPYFGFLTSGFIFLFSVLSVLGGLSRRGFIIYFIISASTIFVVWGLFVVLLRMYLPQGSLINIL